MRNFQTHSYEKDGEDKNESSENKSKANPEIIREFSLRSISKYDGNFIEKLDCFANEKIVILWWPSFLQRL